MPWTRGSNHFSVRAGDRLIENIAWCYETPIAEIPKIAGRLCFYNKKVDLEIDGDRQARPSTTWS